jgi:hypothetical protein
MMQAIKNTLLLVNKLEGPRECFKQVLISLFDG